MKPLRLVALVAAIVIVGAGIWYLRYGRSQGPGNDLTVYYTKVDGNTLGRYTVSFRPRQPGESSDEHVRNAVLYAAVQAIAGPPSDVQAVRFPTGTRVTAATVAGSTATVDLSADVNRQPGGSFAENGEFKAFVYTVTGVPGIDAVQVTIGGQTLPTLPGGHLELDQPLHRSDF